ncbi:metallophosphoesterase [Clostridiaceae bacterium 35-E11]
MKIGIISDTHGMIRIAQNVLGNMEKIDLLVHLGDHYEDAMLLRKQIDIEVVAVKGNCDSHIDAQDEIILEIGAHKILLVHGHQYGVKADLGKLYYKALEAQSDIVLFGHTHVPIKIQHEGVWMINPGSIGLPRAGHKASYAILEIEDKDIKSEIIAV